MNQLTKKQFISVLKTIRNEKIIENIKLISIDGTKVPQVQYLLKRKDYIK